MKKKASLEIKVILEVIIAIVGIFILIILMFKILTPYFNKNEKAAESYFNTLKEEIKKADEGKTGEFLIWENDNVYLVYFDKDMRVSEDNLNFFIDTAYENYICMCYIKNKEEGETICKYCMSLGYAAKYPGKELTWVIGKDDKIEIQKQDEEYVFGKEFEFSGGESGGAGATGEF